MSKLQRVGLIGGGVIGGGWAARFALNGIDVALYDSDPQAERKIGEVMANAERAFDRLMGELAPAKGKVELVGSLEAAIAEADYVQESTPEREDLKRKVLAEIDAHAPGDTLVGSSTSGLLPSRLQADMARPERFLVSHPFNPVYLLPLVELCGGEKTAPEAIARAGALLEGVGMKPLVIRKEIDAFVADRLMEALWREALWLVNDGVATAEEVDDAIRYGCGLRWAQMGTFQTFTVAGGEAGMRHFLSQFGPALKWPWTKLMDTPELTEELIERIAGQCEEQSAGHSVRDLERIRDDNLVDILKALKANGWSAGETLAAYQKRLQEGPA